ncbi:hypothetical protein ACP8HI_22400 [Paenibacillus sp. FA6]|uniref:hypothetical protein n=1 Tax=Paenibacillus sp. FA6 TaxID=3413029 RepID=UPI003F654D8C
MRLKAWLHALVLLCTITVFLSGCGSSKPSWTSFEGAANEKSFPVPKEANQRDHSAANLEMNVANYSLPGLKEDDLFPAAYLEAISEWGWLEDEEDQQDVARVFKKDNKVVQVTILDDYFVIMMPKANDKSMVRSLEVK